MPSIFQILIFLALKLLLFPTPMGMAQEHLDINSGATCSVSLQRILNRSLKINTNIEDEFNNYRRKHQVSSNRGAIYQFAIWYFKIFKKFYMDLNGNARPIYYVEEDSGSYLKIMRFIELLRDKPHSNKVDDKNDLPQNDMNSLEAQPQNFYEEDESYNELETDLYQDLLTEIKSWMESYQQYDTDMKDMIMNMGLIQSYIDQIKNIIETNQAPYPQGISLKLFRQQVLTEETFIIHSKDDFIFDLKMKLNSRKKDITGSLLKGPGKIHNRELLQSILQERLKHLLFELGKVIATKDNTVSGDIVDIYENLLLLLKNPNLNPSIKYVFRRERQETMAEYLSLYQVLKINVDKLDDIAKKSLETLGPYYREKLKVDQAKEWVTTIKASRIGAIGIASATALYEGQSILLSVWNSYHQEPDFIKEMTEDNSEDGSGFKDNFQQYLMEKHSIHFIKRLAVSEDLKLTLSSFSKDPKEAHLEKESLQKLNQIINQRKKYLMHKKESAKSAEEIQKAIDQVISFE